MTPQNNDVTRRLKKLQKLIKKQNLDAVILTDPFNTHYISGMRSSLAYIVVTPADALLLVDGRYIEVAQESVDHMAVKQFTSIAKSLKAWAKSAKPNRIGLEGCVPWATWQMFDDILPGTQWSEAGELVAKLRLIKSASEIKLLAASAELNDAIYEHTVNSLEPGMTEIDVRNIIRGEADRRGAEGLSFDCIVASGATGSRPHYVPGTNPLVAGDLLLIDMGVIVEGYCSDMTRVVHLSGKKPKARMMRAFEATLKAEKSALKRVKPGVKCADLHGIAVDVLKKHKLDRYFTHSLGHGVGLEIHEAPRLNASSETILEPGMIITIEPGVYLPGLGGIRIEDLVAVTKTGHRVLSKAKKQFRTVPFE